MHDARERIADNPFYVLELATTASRIEVERQGQKLLGLLELGLASARIYQTPLGPRERSTEDVRRAMAELRDPRKRLAHELWARLPARGDESTPLPPAGDEQAAPEASFPDAFAAAGWTRGGRS